MLLLTWIVQKSGFLFETLTLWYSTFIILIRATEGSGGKPGAAVIIVHRVPMPVDRKVLPVYKLHTNAN